MGPQLLDGAAGRAPGGRPLGHPNPLVGRRHAVAIEVIAPVAVADLPLNCWSLIGGSGRVFRRGVCRVHRVPVRIAIPPPPWGRDRGAYEEPTGDARTKATVVMMEAVMGATVGGTMAATGARRRGRGCEHEEQHPHEREADGIPDHVDLLGPGPHLDQYDVLDEAADSRLHSAPGRSGPIKRSGRLSGRTSTRFVLGMAWGAVCPALCPRPRYPHGFPRTLRGHRKEKPSRKSAFS